MDEKQINAYVAGARLESVDTRNDEVTVTFDNDVVLIFTGGYCREVFVDAKRRKITFEKLD